MRDSRVTGERWRLEQRWYQTSRSTRRARLDDILDADDGRRGRWKSWREFRRVVKNFFFLCVAALAICHMPRFGKCEVFFVLSQRHISATPQRKKKFSPTLRNSRQLFAFFTANFAHQHREYHRGGLSRVVPTDTIATSTLGRGAAPVSIVLQSPALSSLQRAPVSSDVVHHKQHRYQQLARVVYQSRRSRHAKPSSPGHHNQHARNSCRRRCG